MPWITKDYLHIKQLSTRCRHEKRAFRRPFRD